MAHYCIRPEKESCSWRFTGTAIGTDKLLCNCYSEHKPCEEEEEELWVNRGDDVEEADFVDFFGDTRENILAPYKKYAKEEIFKRELFKDASKLSRGELHGVYENSDYYKISLDHIHPGRFEYLRNMKLTAHPIYEMCGKYYPNPKDVRVLDYGGGSWQNGLVLALKGYDVTVADLGHKTFLFNKYLCRKCHIPITSVQCTNNYNSLRNSVFEKFDYLICADVLEHVDEPLELLRALMRMMKDDGIMYLSTFFDDGGDNDPSHLRKNVIKYKNRQMWLGWVIESGLVPITIDVSGVPKGFVKRSFAEKLTEDNRKITKKDKYETIR